MEYKTLFLLTLFISSTIFHQSESKSKQQELDENNKPKFESCNSYQPQVKEEEPKGTFVVQVTAIDNDPKDKGGNVTYSLVRREGERQHFEIDPVTGTITTLTHFDRDEPVRQKELYLTVQARDNGRPQLADICTIKVTVIDINDNPPSFDSSSYSPNVAEDARPGSIVAKIFAYDIDDGENSKLTYSVIEDNPNREFSKFFKIDPATGVLRLNSTLNGEKDRVFTATVQVRDNGTPRLSTEAPIQVKIVGSDKQSPNIIQAMSVKELAESYHDFELPIFTITASSNMDDPQVVFELIKGKTAQTNKDQTFILKPSSDNTAEITLARPLDYEQVTEYTLTVRVKNKDTMEATAKYTISVLDVNDEIPTFIDIIKGSVIENEGSGQKAMKVTALDKDGTSANNIVKYEIVGEGKDKFAIDENTGEITSLLEFDREEVPIYQIAIRAYDNSPSALGKKNEPNSVVQQFQITIEDRNDNKPVFTEPIYVFEDISETSDIGKDVGEVKAEDKDAASYIKYSITSGDDNHHFSIEDMTGRIKVNKRLNFEEIEEYNLEVKADDGIYNDTAKVTIRILNENDKLPQFEDFNRTLEFEEEKMIEGCLVRVRAYDPDIKNRMDNQHILFSVDPSKKNFFDIDNDGCVTLKKPLDRDKPNGSISRQVFIYADDNDGKPPSQKNTTEINVYLIDINDNAPFLNVTEIVWYENEPPGKIVTLSADDYDSNDNGPPFTFLLGDATEDIHNKFSIVEGNVLSALVTFDREQQKYYDIPISITDSGSPPQTSHNNILKVIIGDKNDNEAKDGESDIFVYKYEKLNADISIGRVYVDDLDDWDLNDKVFVKTDDNSAFTLSSTDNGMIVMGSTAVPGTYDLQFQVTESHLPEIPPHTVNAKVKVEVKAIPQEAVVKSGSIRIEGITTEEFIDKSIGGFSKKDLLQFEIARILNTSRDNVDVFTVLPSNNSLIDVRFSAHGSPYYYPEKLNNIATANQGTLQNKLNVKFVMISINECVNASVCPDKDCSNTLAISDEPANVFTNKTSFVGIKAVATASCEQCMKPTFTECFNGGTFVEEGICKCSPGFEGPHCEILGIGFQGSGCATYAPFDSCNNSNIQLSITTQTDNGLVFYLGPLAASQASISKDYMSLEVISGYPVFKYYVGDQLTKVQANKSINDGATHFIEIQYSTEDIRMEVDNCKTKCLGWTGLTTKRLIRTNGPLQLGGLKFKFQEEAKTIWSGAGPIMNDKFSGCIRNLTHNGVLFNLGDPSDKKLATVDCAYTTAQAVTLGRDSLVAILVCIAVLIILMLALVVYRRKQDNLQEKESDDIRENIINYEEEGGGECDINFDINVLRELNLDEKPKHDNFVPDDINMFLNSKKTTCDKDPDSLPFDDVRHYAYEGDGNSTGSLSSLASCTDDGDLNFSHISSFGPRFRRLANIYGEDEDDEESENGNEESWC